MDIQRNIQINNEYLTVTYTKKNMKRGIRKLKFMTNIKSAFYLRTVWRL